MSATGKEAIQLRNEGAAAFIQRAKEFGTEKEPNWSAAVDELQRRIGLRCSIAIGKNEQQAMTEAIQEAVSNTYIAMIYVTLMDGFGFGETRLKRFKQEFDALTMTAYGTDRMGRRYFSVKEVAETINKLYDMGIDVAVVEETENDVETIKRRYACVDEIFAFLRKKGFQEAYDAFFAEVWGRDCAGGRATTKEQRAIAKKRRKQDRSYKAPDMYLFDPEVSKGYLTIIATVLREWGMDLDDVNTVCGKVNEYLNWVLDKGQAALDTLEKENVEFKEEVEAV